MLNVSFNNSGDIFGQVWEGKLIVDNSSNWISPNKHWHDLDIWVPPNDKFFYKLPVELTYISPGEHHFSLLIIDKTRVNISLYESNIFTPNS